MTQPYINRKINVFVVTYRFHFTRKTVRFHTWFALGKAKSCIKTETNFISNVKSLNSLYLLYAHQCYHFWIHTTPLCNWWRVANNIFSQYVQCMRYCDVIHIAQCKIISPSKLNTQILLLNINVSFDAFWMMFRKKKKLVQGL